MVTKDQWACLYFRNFQPPVAPVTLLLVMFINRFAIAPGSLALQGQSPVTWQSKRILAEKEARINEES
ncbi:MAG: hypothetical protein WCC87_25480 [Candidatus Korobacteraceae bacterium]